jgi:hypothetical protein
MGSHTYSNLVTCLHTVRESTVPRVSRPSSRSRFFPIKRVVLHSCGVGPHAAAVPPPSSLLPWQRAGKPRPCSPPLPPDPTLFPRSPPPNLPSRIRDPKHPIGHALCTPPPHTPPRAAAPRTTRRYPVVGASIPRARPPHRHLNPSSQAAARRRHILLPARPPLAPLAGIPSSAPQSLEPGRRSGTQLPPLVGRCLLCPVW